MGYIYADLYFLTNLGMNFATLWLAARLGRLPGKPRRLAGAALLGALYALAFLVPSLHWLFSPVGKVCFSLLLVAVAFAPRTWRALGRATAWFYGVSFLTGGIALGLGFLTGSPSAALGGVWVFGGSVRWWVLGCSTGGCLLLAGTLLTGTRRRLRQALLVPVELIFGDDAVTLRALVDTGNRLQDPLTGSPAVVAETAALKGVLPDPVWACLAGGTDLGGTVEGLAGTSWASRLRVVPFRTVGEPAGLMVGFRPDRIIIHDQGRRREVADAVVCTYPRPLSVAGEYRALLNPDLLEEG
ncbi:MAG: sigma-E processing peptidase SpoIIGA [bacterium]|nr:sigma-E processing peptidase SpoIIGA [bacterium]